MGEFDGAEILASLLVSAVGFVFFSYGRKMQRGPQTIAGVMLLVFPYFVSGTWLVLGIAAALLAALFTALRFGW